MNQIKYNKWLLLVLWVLALTYLIGYWMGHNLLPITDWVRTIFEPLHIAMFGDGS
ncbi:hypothetical protein ACFFGV_13625 [Pontibacillus salicampi]|uniref:Uncharacterized protein n=1 Tax=Pontibacillus salicampi TaxID=1449801 RepID=A0ABV6LQD1_9BACI